LQFRTYIIVQMMLGSLVLLSSCATDTTDEILPVLPSTLAPASFISDPQANGSNSVGYRRWDHTYDSRATGAARTIRINVWYPTRDTLTDKSVEYIDGNGLTVDKVQLDASLHIVDKTSQFPVLVFSHGHVAWAGAGAHVAKYFAAKGWIVVGPDHIDNTLDTNLKTRPSSLYAHRGLDLTATLDALDALPSGDALAGRLSLGTVVAHGHSFGTQSMWNVAGAEFKNAVVYCKELSEEDSEKACSAQTAATFKDGLRDARVAGVLLTGGSIDRSWFGDDGEDGITIPVMILSGEDDGAHEGVLDNWDSFQGLNMTRIDLAGGCHPTFETSPLVGDCDLGVERGYEIVNSYTYAFAQDIILGTTNKQGKALLDGSLAPFDEATYYKR